MSGRSRRLRRPSAADRRCSRSTASTPGYGPFRALFDVSFALHPGRVLALLGSNGAGKTTIARVCSGLVVPTKGAVRFDGDDLTGAPPYQFARRGIVHAPEGRSVFASLTVRRTSS